MTVKVLVVDDSSFIRRQICQLVAQDPQLTVIDTARNGREAVDKALRLRPDVIVMDIEMPVLDGISAVREIMANCPAPILMFSSLTHEGARATLDALDAGALDFLPKKFEDMARDRDEAASLLQQRIKAIARRPAALAALARPRGSQPLAHPSSWGGERLPEPPRPIPGRSGKRYQLVAIGTSTGGPAALQRVLTALPGAFPHPILLIQHMPAAFTATFAIRLDSLCRIGVKEAEDGDVLRAGQAYLAPGGKQMLLEGRGAGARIRILEGNDKVNYKPCIDITFASAAKACGDKVLAIVLTGMGADGREGARLLKAQGATIWAQDEASSVVYGMPQAVARAGLASESLPLDRVASRLLLELGCQPCG